MIISTLSVFNMRLLFVNTDLGYGGAEKMMVWVANQMAKLGNDVTFLTYRDETANYQPLSSSIRRIHLQLERNGGTILGLLKSSRVLHKHIKKERYDVAIAFLSPSQIRLIKACKGTETISLVSQRGDPYYKSQQSGIRRMVSKWMNKCFGEADAYIFQTRQAMLYYPQYIQEKGTVIANPINKLPRTAPRKADKRIVNVARLDIKQKRQDVLIEAFRMISDKYPDYILEFYGSGDDEQKLKQMAGNHKRIFFKGITTNVVESIQNASMFVLTSDFEGIPNALLEAMSLGVPCISTDCSPGGAAMLIDSPDKGILVEKGNPVALAAAMEQYIMNPDKAELCGQQAQDVNNIYNEEQIASQWNEVFNVLVKNRRHE